MSNTVDRRLQRHVQEYQQGNLDEVAYLNGEYDSRSTPTITIEWLEGRVARRTKAAHENQVATGRDPAWEGRTQAIRDRITEIETAEREAETRAQDDFNRGVAYAQEILGRHPEYTASYVRRVISDRDRGEGMDVPFSKGFTAAYEARLQELIAEEARDEPAVLVAAEFKRGLTAARELFERIPNLSNAHIERVCNRRLRYVDPSPYERGFTQGYVERRDQILAAERVSGGFRAACRACPTCGVCS